MSDTGDIVAVGLDLKPKTLLQAYSNGIFPWPTAGLPLLWYCPQRRAIIDFSKFHISKRVHQYLKKASWRYTVNRDFAGVMQACSERGEEGSWISDEMKSAYLEMHRLGHAHSVEVWHGDHLVGGMYGIDVGGYFAGESMFHREDNASKAAIVFVVALQKRVGRNWMDIQVMTQHMKAYGAEEVSRKTFLEKIRKSAEAMKLGSGIRPFDFEEIEMDYGALCKFIE